jgi:SAM-dependent methyltransferase
MEYGALALNRQEDQYAILYEWIREACPDGISVCDVGGGGHFNDFPSQLRPWARRIVGVDPDPGVLRRPYYDAAHLAKLEDWAPVTDERFDVLLAVYVFEHIDSASRFLNSARSLLVPGGALFGITPNLWHLFGAISALTERLGIAEWLLRQLRDRELIEAYHFPVRYRLNSLRHITRVAKAAGFTGASFRCLERPGSVASYLPDRLSAIPARYSELVTRVGKPELYGTVLFRLEA